MSAAERSGTLPCTVHVPTCRGPPGLPTRIIENTAMSMTAAQNSSAISWGRLKGTTIRSHSR